MAVHLHETEGANIELDQKHGTQAAAQSREAFAGEALELASQHIQSHRTGHTESGERKEQSKQNHRAHKGSHHEPVYREDHHCNNCDGGRAPYDWNDGSGYVLNLMLGYR